MLKTVLLLSCIAFVQSENMEPFIVGGKEVDIDLFSHSAFVAVQVCIEQCCNWVAACGASILNQNIVLSAAHCFRDLVRPWKMMVRAGSSNKMQGSVRYVSKMIIHKDYNRITVENDIVLAYFKNPFQLGSHIKRVIVMKELPNTNVGYLAGWGEIDDITKQETNLLKRVEQRLWSRKECKEVLRTVPPGILCGGIEYGSEYPSQGDGGYALVVNGSIQVGMASFRRPIISKSIVAYTDLSYFYQWIMRAAKAIYCDESVKSNKTNIL